MNASEKFCLRWNDFETNISSTFKELREDKEFFDVTLACDDSQVQAHKVILSACSPFFRSILKKNPHQHPLLYLKGVKYEELVLVLNFMYHGEVSIVQEDVNSFLAVAEDLQVKGLTQMIHKPLLDTNVNTPMYKEISSMNKQQKPKFRTSYEQPVPSDSSGHTNVFQDISTTIKTEAPVVDVECEPEYSPGHHIVLQGDYEDYHQEQNTGYQDQQVEQTGNISQDFYSQHWTKASDGGYLCNLCGKQARDLYALKGHLEGKHEITPGYNCPVCNMFCKTKNILVIHKKNSH